MCDAKADVKDFKKMGGCKIVKGEEKDLVSNKIFNGEKFVEKTKTVELQ